MALLVGITINFGVKSQFYVDEKTLLGSIQFVCSMILLVRAAKLRWARLDVKMGHLSYETFGSCIKPFIIGVTLAKFALEIFYQRFMTTEVLAKIQNIWLRILVKDLMNSKLYHPSVSDQSTSSRGMGVIFLGNTFDLLCVGALWMLDKKLPNKVNQSHLPNMKVVLSSIVVALKFTIYFLLLLEVV